MTISPFSTRVPITPKPRPRKKKAKRELVPSDVQAMLAECEELSALDTLGIGMVMTIRRRPSVGVREIAAYDVSGALIGVSTVFGWSDEEE